MGEGEEEEEEEDNDGGGSPLSMVSGKETEQVTPTLVLSREQEYRVIRSATLF